MNSVTETMSEKPKMNGDVIYSNGPYQNSKHEEKEYNNIEEKNDIHYNNVSLDEVVDSEVFQKHNNDRTSENSPVFDPGASEDEEQETDDSANLSLDGDDESKDYKMIDRVDKYENCIDSWNESCENKLDTEDSEECCVNNDLQLTDTDNIGATEVEDISITNFSDVLEPKSLDLNGPSDYLSNKSNNSEVPVLNNNKTFSSSEDSVSFDYNEVNRTCLTDSTTCEILARDNVETRPVNETDVNSEEVTNSGEVDFCQERMDIDEDLSVLPGEMGAEDANPGVPIVDHEVRKVETANLNISAGNVEAEALPTSPQFDLEDDDLEETNSSLSPSGRDSQGVQETHSVEASASKNDVIETTLTNVPALEEDCTNQLPCSSQNLEVEDTNSFMSNTAAGSPQLSSINCANNILEPDVYNKVDDFQCSGNGSELDTQTDDNTNRLDLLDLSLNTSDDVKLDSSIDVNLIITGDSDYKINHVDTSVTNTSSTDAVNVDKTGGGEQTIEPVYSISRESNIDRVINQVAAGDANSENCERKVEKIKISTLRKNKMQSMFSSTGTCFKCFKCNASNFSSLAELNTHRVMCLEDNNVADPVTNTRTARKLYFCSACGTYYENWNLFVHMRDEHKRFICLYCMGMFAQPDKLSLHLQIKHNITEYVCNSLREFYVNFRDDGYLVCCVCEKMFTESEDFYHHVCKTKVTEDQNIPCMFCKLTNSHFPSCPQNSDRITNIQPFKPDSIHSKRRVVTNNKTKSRKKKKNSRISVTNKTETELQQNVANFTNTSFTDNFATGNTANLHDNSCEVKPQNEIDITKRIEKSVNKSKHLDRVTSSLQSIEASISRVLEKFTTTTLSESNKAEADADMGELMTSAETKEETSNTEVQPEQSTTNNYHIQDEHKDRLPSDNESSDSGKLTIAFDHPSEVVEPAEQEPEAEEEKDHVLEAGSDIVFTHMELEDSLETIEATTMMKLFIKQASWNCSYCAHAKRIAVNGKQLALHLLSQHRFTLAQSEDDESLKLESLTIVNNKLKSSLDQLDAIHFNTDTYDTSDKSIFKPHEKVYECFHCLFATYIHKELYTHNRKAHQTTTFLCIMCKSNFYHYSELLCHLCMGIYQPGGHVINPDIKFRCFICNIDPLPSSFRLMVHLRKTHNSCDICFDVCVNQAQLSAHVWKHKLAHMCYRCGIAYRNKPDITKHLFWKHGTESVFCKKCLQKKWPHVYHFCTPPASFVCEECNLYFKKAVALKVHKRLHTDDKPYPCDECEERFISKKLLDKHIVWHKEVNEQPEINVTNSPVAENTTEIQDSQDEVDVGENVDNSAVEQEQVKEKKSKKKNVTDVFDLPPVNLSESDDSDEDSLPKTSSVEPVKPVLQDDVDTPVETEAVQPPPPTELDGVWDNFQTYLREQNDPSNSKTVMTKRMQLIMLSDHDYYSLPVKQAEGSRTDEDQKIDKEHDYCDNKDNSNNKDRPGTRSSSSSSSDSDSSCTECGSNCSCTSSSSSSSSSSSTQSASSPNNKRKTKKKLTKKRKDKKVEPAPAELEINPEPIISVSDPVENIIHESDLETDETASDEEFYDYNPTLEANKNLAASRTKLLAHLNDGFDSSVNNGEGISSLLSSPVRPTDEVTNNPPKKKLKSKKKRSQTRLNNMRPNRWKKIGPVVDQHPPQPAVIPPVNVVHTPSIQNTLLNTFEVDSAHNSESDAGRPKRKRIPSKFYGFSSDNEGDGATPSPPRKKEKHEPPSSISLSLSNNRYTSHDDINHSPRLSTVNTSTPLTWKIERTNNDVDTPKVQPIKIKTTQTGSRQSSPFYETGDVSRTYRPPPVPLTPFMRKFNMNGNHSALTAAAIAKGEKIYCFCQCPYDEVSEMIACDADDCKIEWFHFECVGIMVPPKGKWYCPDCKKKAAAQREFMPLPPEL